MGARPYRESMVVKPRHIEVTPETEALIRARIDSGEFASADQVLQAALRVMEQVAGEYGASRDRAREKIASGLAQADAGELLDGPAAMRLIKDDLLKRASEDGRAG